MMHGASRSISLVAAAWLVLALAAPSNTLAQRDFSNVEVKATRVAGNVYMLTGAGGNIGASVGADGILIVDDQFAPLADKIRAALKGLNEGKLRFVLNTHWHGDHTGGNAAFGREATIIAHDNVRKRVSTKQTNIFGETEPSPKEAWPVITFGQSLSIHFNGEEIRVLHFPHGHTDGDSVIHFTKSNVVHMGDDMFSGMFPFIDIDSGGSIEGLIDAVEAVLEEIPPDAKLIPGHGPLSTIDDLKEYRDMLKATSEFVRKGIEAGKSVEEIQAEFPDKWKEWETSFVDSARWVSFLHGSLTEGQHP